MAKFEITTPDGKKYEVEAADAASANATVEEYASGKAQEAGPLPAAEPAPATLKPGTRAYADWAAAQARAGKTLPQVSDPKYTQTQSSVLDPLVQGVTFGFGDELRGAVQGGIAAAQGKDFGSAYNQVVDESRNSLEHERQVNPWGSMAAEIGGSLPTGALAGGGLVARGATALGRAAIGTAVGAGQGMLYGMGSSDAKSLGGRVVDGGLSALIGGAIGAAAPAIGQLGRRLISPNPATSAAHTAAADVMANEGITLTAGQRTGRKGLQYLEAELGKGRADDLMEQQAEQFTRAALARAGINAPRATPEVIDNTFQTVGNQFDNMAMVTNTPFDQTLQNNLLGVAADYADTAANPAPVVERLVNRMGQLAQTNSGQMTGRVYQSMRSEISRLLPSADPATKLALREMQDALDDAVERNLNGQTLQAWQELRRRYRNLMVVERAVTSAGDKAASGLITPAQLRMAAIQKAGRRTFARGNSDYTELANAGVQTMTPLPQSGTANRMAAQFVGLLPTAIGAAAGSPGGVLGAMAGAAAGAAIPRLAGRAILSGPGRAILANQAATGTRSSALESLLRAIGTPTSNRVELTIHGGNNR